MDSPEPRGDGDDAIAIKIGVIIIAVLVSILHINSWSKHPPDVDPINFTKALATYDVSIDAPHPPGYPLYVGMARLLAAAVGEARAYQAVNLLLLLGTAGLMVVIGARVGSARIGLATATLLITHPLALSATVIPECYITDAFASAAVVAWGLAVPRDRRGGWLVGFGVLFLTIGLIRAVSCVLLLPLALAAVAIRPGRGRLRALASVLAIAALATIAAYGATVWLVGGLEVYRTAVDRVMGAAFRGSSVLGGAPIARHALMIAKLWGWFAILAAPSLVVIPLGRVLRGWPSPVRRPDRVLLALATAWILPPLVFYSMVYYLKPTYQLIYLPALMLVLAVGIDRIMPGRGVVRFAPVVLISALQLGFFWFGGGGLPKPLYHLTREFVRDQDSAWIETERVLAARTQDTLVVFRSHPRLRPMALSLMLPGEPFATIDASGTPSVFDGRRWVGPEHADLAPYRKALVIRSEGGEARFLTTRLADLSPAFGGGRASHAMSPTGRSSL